MRGPQGPPRDKFYRDGEQFLKKKQHYVQEKQAQLERDMERQREQARLMSENSRRIVQEKNRGGSFLERNYYNKQLPQRANKERLNSAVSANRSQASGMRAGSRGSGYGLNNSNYSGQEDFGQGRMFSPQIN